MIAVSPEKFPHCKIHDLDIPSMLNTSRSLIDLTKDGKPKQSKKQATLNYKGSLGIVHQQSQTMSGKNSERKKKKQVVLNDWLSRMKPNEHFVSSLNKILEVIEKKKKNNEEYLKSMGSNVNLSDRNQAQVWSVLQGMMDEVEVRFNCKVKSLLCDRRIVF